ncbi:Ubiquitin carboxyl-terminal hydrolase 4 [Diplonema papillatum]|nr:Ubiquitin carboxyl-terminal hydrolase 4 [Diplonema papillatum]
MGNTCCSHQDPPGGPAGARSAVRRPIKPPPPPRGAGPKQKAACRQSTPFDTLFDQYTIAIENTLVDNVDAADVPGVAKSVVTMVDPRQLALAKLRSFDDHQKLLSPIWSKFAGHEEKFLTKESLKALLEAYLCSLEEFLPTLQITLIRRIVSLFVPGESKKLEADVYHALQGGTSAAVKEFFDTRRDHLSELTDTLWTALDENEDGKVDRKEFERQFLNSTVLVDMGDAVHSATADDVAAVVAKKLSLHLKKPPGRCGLVNLGNTCYMNAAVQCLSATTRLRQHFLSDRFMENMNTANPLGCKGKLAKAFSRLLKQMWCGNSAFSPKDFRSVVAASNSMFQGWNQHDSQEFISYLLDGLHEDLNEAVSRDYNELPDEPDRPDNQVAKLWWENHVRRNKSVIVRLYHGQHKSLLQCTTCGHRSIAFDPFSIASIPIQNSTKAVTLEACLDLYCEQEDLVRQCEKCPSTKSFKKILFWRLPRYLVLHVKRFSQGGSKINTPINVPAVFDPAPWCARPAMEAVYDTLLPSPTSPNGAATAGHTRMSSLTSIASSVDDLLPEGRYHLFAKINHFGTSRSGHYTSTAKIGSDWHSFDDSIVTLLRQPPHLKPSPATYVAFYELK